MAGAQSSSTTKSLSPLFYIPPRQLKSDPFCLFFPPPNRKSRSAPWTQPPITRGQLVHPLDHQSSSRQRLTPLPACPNRLCSIICLSSLSANNGPSENSLPRAFCSIWPSFRMRTGIPGPGPSFLGRKSKERRKRYFELAARGGRGGWRYRLVWSCL